MKIAFKTTVFLITGGKSTSRLYAKIAKVDILGRAIISAGTTEIANWTFNRNEHVRSVPGTVKQIGERAFAGCVNLKAVQLEEGIQTIGSNAFTDCNSLTELTPPDSIRELNGWAFYHFTGLQKSAYNRSKTILYCYLLPRRRFFRFQRGSSASTTPPLSRIPMKIKKQQWISVLPTAVLFIPFVFVSSV